ncbi:hypothetical protein K0J45_10735 [Shewanella alkalitolerans]|uniref:hypothetical protein n=1 Tax=Shewanella alkalitolerans TaxID=2864209 RepID=UPI001C65D69F|nr:hypothetical protein [Shewanella alkalitolerans]QYJ96049.1 hypothetical protein K0J45_10735 [Shewanella alkalitolerans]
MLLRVHPKDSQSSWLDLNLNLNLNLNADIDIEQLVFCHLASEPLAGKQADQGAHAEELLVKELSLEELSLKELVPNAPFEGPLSIAIAARIGWKDLSLFLVVLLAHLALLAFLSWQFKGPYLAQESIKQDKKAISAYMLTQAEFDAMKAKSRPAEVPVNAPKQDTLNQRAEVTEDNPAPIFAQQSAAPIKPSPEKEASATQVTRFQPNVTQASVEPSVVPAVDPSEFNIAPKIEVHADTQKKNEAFSFKAAKGLNLERGAADSGAVSAATGDYMARYRQAQLDKLVEHAADKATQKKSMSEMDGEMRVLALPKENEYETAITLDSKVDPNRIVKIGDTCYRVVSVATAINPHGENLGFPFKCGGDKVKQAIKDSLDKHLSMMGVKVKDKN